MIKEDALEKLELEAGASQQDIKQQYQEFYNEFKMRITNAPTTHQKTLYQRKLRQLEEAYNVLTNENAESLDSEIPWTSPGEAVFKTNKTKLPEPPKEKIINAKALELLGLKEPFTNTALDNAFNKQKAACEKGMDQALNESIKQAYKSSLQEVIAAYQLLIPITKLDTKEKKISREFKSDTKNLVHETKNDLSKINDALIKCFLIFKYGYTLVISFILTILYYSIFSYYYPDSFYINLLWFGLIATVLPSVGSLGILYSAWCIVQDGNNKTTPQKAIIYLFIPFYNLYWIFVSYKGLFKEFNRVYNKKIDLGFVSAYCVICLIPYLNLLTIILTPILIYQIYNISKSILSEKLSQIPLSKHIRLKKKLYLASSTMILSFIIVFLLQLGSLDEEIKEDFESNIRLAESSLKDQDRSIALLFYESAVDLLPGTNWSNNYELFQYNKLWSKIESIKEEITNEAEKGNVKSQIEIGEIHQLDNNDRLAKKWFNKAVENGALEANNYLATIYDFNDNGESDWSKAAQLYERGLNSTESAWSSMRLGEFYLFGVGGIERDINKAKELFKSADQKDYLEVLKDINNLNYHILNQSTYGNRLYIDINTIKSDFKLFPYVLKDRDQQWSVNISYELGKAHHVKIYPFDNSYDYNDIEFTHHTEAQDLYSKNGQFKSGIYIYGSAGGYRSIGYIYYRGDFYDSDGNLLESIDIKVPALLCWLP